MSARAFTERSVLALAFAAIACGPSLPRPEVAEHQPSDRMLVPYPPPPQQVEIIPEKPREPPDVVWIDGAWIWNGRRWEWQKGRWEVPPKDARYAPPMIEYLPNKEIAWNAGRWYAPAAP